MAFQPIPLSSPFISDEIPSATAFDILAEREADGLVLVRFDGIRVWKSRAHVENRATFWRELPAEQISTRTIVAEPRLPAVEADGRQLSALERFALRVTSADLVAG